MLTILTTLTVLTVATVVTDRELYVRKVSVSQKDVHCLVALLSVGVFPHAELHQDVRYEHV